MTDPQKLRAFRRHCSSFRHCLLLSNILPAWSLGNLVKINWFLTHDAPYFSKLCQYIVHLVQNPMHRPTDSKLRSEDPLDTLVAGCGGGTVDGAARGRLNLMLWLLVMRPSFFWNSNLKSFHSQLFLDAGRSLANSRNQFSISSFVCSLVLQLNGGLACLTWSYHGAP